MIRRGRIEWGMLVTERYSGHVGRVVPGSAETERHVLVRYEPDGLVMDTSIDRLTEGRRRMTYTISRLSGKAIRLMARYLAVQKMGGKLTDTPKEFHSRALADRPGASRVEVERTFGILTDEFEERLRDEEGFIGDCYEVAGFVREKLKDGFLRDGEVAADHRSSPAAPVVRPVARVPGHKGPKEVEKILKQLRGCSDPSEARMLRRTLRRMGHRGGLRE